MRGNVDSTPTIVTPRLKLRVFQIVMHMLCVVLILCMENRNVHWYVSLMDVR